MQAKDIPDQAVLDAVWAILDRTDHRSVSRWDLAAEFPLVPEKVLMAKARKLIRRRQLEGCVCGCAGDFTLAALIPGARYIPPQLRSLA